MIKLLYDGRHGRHRTFIPLIKDVKNITGNTRVDSLHVYCNFLYDH